jgi:hypothetical protein
MTLPSRRLDKILMLSENLESRDLAIRCPGRGADPLDKFPTDDRQGANLEQAKEFVSRGKALGGRQKPR